MEIRQFRDSDRAAVIRLWKDCGLIRSWNDPDKDISRKLDFQPELFFVGESLGQIMATAMAGYDGHRGSVFYLAVAPDRQQSGLGRRLMEHVEQRLLEFGCPKINVVIRSPNTEVLAFYRRLGYLPDQVESMGKRLIPDSVSS